ncbi:MAG: flagellar FliJ family protein [Oscillospiraceae bacterium]|jgi:flagellar FliJ protein|nr:flagellar FliJ family protein [Oscillospiraceae bacterium]
MGGFKFSLQKILNYRGQLLAVEEGKLREIDRELLLLEAEHAALLQKIKTAEDSLQEEAARGLEVMKYKLRKDYIHGLVKLMEELKPKVVAVRARREAQLAMVLEASKNQKILEKLRERHLLEYNEMLAKREEKAIEEFVNNLNSASLAYGS